MKVSFDTRISVSTDLLVSKVSDEMVILNYSNETYYGLNRIGSRVWDSLTKGNSILDIYEIFRSDFKVPKEKLLRDILNLVEQLLKQGLVTVTAN